MSVEIVQIYSDGACKGNPGPGGWGAILRYGEHEKHIYGSEVMTTNNRMELTAAIEALMRLKRSCQIEFYTDSQYLRKGVTEWLENWKKNNWKTANKKPVKNEDLWRSLDEQIRTHHIKWYWVKGHSGHVENELADQLANKAIDEAMGKL